MLNTRHMLSDVERTRDHPAGMQRTGREDYQEVRIRQVRQTLDKYLSA